MGIWEGKAAPRTVINRVCVVLDQHPSWFAHEPFSQGQPRPPRPWGCALLPGPQIKPFPASFPWPEVCQRPTWPWESCHYQTGSPHFCPGNLKFPRGPCPTPPLHQGMELAFSLALSGVGWRPSPQGPWLLPPPARSTRRSRARKTRVWLFLLLPPPPRALALSPEQFCGGGTLGPHPASQAQM